MNEHVLWYQQPARKWTEALPLGNGMFGAMVFGNPEEDILQLNHEQLWSGYPSDYRNREACSCLETVREKIRNRDEIGAQRLMEEHMSGKFSESYLSMGWITIRGLAQAPYTGFRRQLDLRKAESEWNCVDEKGRSRNASCFIGQPDRTLVYRVTGSGLHAEITMDSPLHFRTEVRDHMLHLTGRAPSHVVPHYWPSDSPVVYHEGAEQGMQFDILLSVETKNGNVTEENDSLNIRDADEIILYVNADVSCCGFDRHPAPDGRDCSASVRDMNREARKIGADRMEERHLREYQPLYLRNILSLSENTDTHIPTDERVRAAGRGKADNGLAELLYHYGRYLLLSCSRKCLEPANLQGIWNKELRPYWSCNYTSNINLEMNYWPAEVCALPECTEPLWKFIRELSVDGRNTAAGYYGCRGWTAHHNSDVWRMARPAGDDGPVYGMGTALFWCMAGGWLCRHLWDHYLFTGDREFLRDTARPLTAGAVDFFLDWQVPAEDGTYTTIPATSPENSYLTERSERCSLAAGSSMDTEIIMDTYGFYLQMSALCGEDSEAVPDPEEQDRIRRVREHLAKMKLPGLDREGKILEWEKERIPAEPGHRHSSPLYGLYPADLITPDDPELYEGCRKFLTWKIRNHSSGFGWGLAWALCLYTRLLDTDAFTEGIRKFLSGSIYPDLLTLHPPLSASEHEVFQIDAGFGYTAAVAESLLQSRNGVLYLLPCLSRDWESGSVSGLRARGGFLVSVVWEDHRLKKAVISEGFRKDLQIRYRNICRKYEKEHEETLTLDENLNIIEE